MCVKQLQQRTSSLKRILFSSVLDCNLEDNCDALVGDAEVDVLAYACVSTNMTYGHAMPCCALFPALLEARNVASYGLLYYYVLHRDARSDDGCRRKIERGGENNSFTKQD